jgi:hypothetical protein
MIILILVLLIPAAYYAGRYVQWRQDVRRFMRRWRGEL